MEQDEENNDMTSHDIGTGKGEEKSGTEGKESGRHDTGTTGADRPAGTSTARDSTSINPEDMDSIDEDMPNMPPA